tara:strand:+ start:252 stop:560 length:309 start_codon:yes stop_codon:yes gene_type:complete
MLETFFASALYKKYMDNNNTHINTNNQNNSNNSDDDGITFIVKAALIIWAVYLAYNCNKGGEKIYKIGVPVFAFFFSIVYLLYYAIYRKLANNPCISNNMTI